MSSAPSNDAPHRVIDDVEFGAGVVVHSFTNLYGCRIGDGTRIGIRLIPLSSRSPPHGRRCANFLG